LKYHKFQDCHGKQDKTEAGTAQTTTRTKSRRKAKAKAKVKVKTKARHKQQEKSDLLNKIMIS
jgi:hypothetical protein